MFFKTFQIFSVFLNDHFTSIKPKRNRMFQQFLSPQAICKITETPVIYLSIVSNNISYSTL